MAGIVTHAEAGTRFRWGMVAVAALFAVVTAVPLSGQEVRYNGSLQYSMGSYIFAQRTHSFYLLSGLGVSAGRLQLDANIPLILQNSGVVSYVGGGALPTGGRDHRAVRTREPGSTVPGRRGSGSAAADSVEFSDEFGVEIGDPTFFGSGEIYSGTGLLRSINLSARTKIPLTDLDSGVGTGEWDYSVGGSVALIAGRVFFFGDLSHWWFGDLPELELQDGFAYGLGTGVPVMEGRGSLLATVTGAESAIRTAEAPMTLGMSFGLTVGESRQLSTGMTFGLSESSPDLGLSLGWSTGL